MTDLSEGIAVLLRASDGVENDSSKRAALAELSHTESISSLTGALDRQVIAVNKSFCKSQNENKYSLSL